MTLVGLQFPKYLSKFLKGPLLLEEESTPALPDIIQFSAIWQKF